MSDASTRSGSPSSSPSISEAPVSRRGSADTTDLDRVNATEVSANIGTPPRPPKDLSSPQSEVTTKAVEQTQACSAGAPGVGLGLSGTSPVRKPCPLSIAAIGDASQRQPTSTLATPVASPSKRYGYAGTSQLILPTVPLLGEPFQPSPAGTPVATPVGRYTVMGTSPSCKSSPPGAMGTGDASQRGTGDASQRTPIVSPMADQSTALKSWLCGSPCGRLPSGPELADLLRAALPEAYDD